VLGVVAIVLGFAISGGAGAAAYFLPAVQAARGDLGQHVVVPSFSPLGSRPVGGVAAATTQGAFTVLLLGSDNDAKFASDQLLTQSMILVRVTPSTGQVTMLSIPRDLFVPITGTSGRAKIDTAYTSGGAANAIATVEQDFGVHIDHYVWIGLRGLTALIDELGGVDVVTTNPVLDDYYPADLEGGNPYDFTRVAVLAGAQHMDGRLALEYVRSRHGDLRGDFGRSDRQQQVLLALRAKAKRLNAADLPVVASAIGDQLKTDMSITEVSDLLPLLGGISLDKVTRVILLPPYTSSARVGDQDVLLPDWNLILPVVAKSFPA
jgi:LCP family protein required for cell wall assembly